MAFVCLQLLKLVRNSAGHIRSVRGWRTVCALITMTSLHPGTAATSFEALRVVTREKGLLSPASFAPCLETALTFVDRHAKVPAVMHSQAGHALWGGRDGNELDGWCQVQMHHAHPAILLEG